MKHSIQIYSAERQGHKTAITLGTQANNRVRLFPFLTLLVVLLTPLFGWFGGSTGALYAQCTTSAPAVLAKWDFNSKTTQCNGAVPKGTGDITSPFLSQGQNAYCPNTNNGCGAALLGTKGFGNTNDFKNAICLAGFWRNDGGLYAAAPGWTVSDVNFHPEIPANLTVSYILPLGKAGSITSFSLQVIQKQYDGTNPSFEKQGVGVYRNGVLIYSQTQPISASTVNGTAMTFTFPNTPEFTSDGSASVDFEIVFGLVHRLIKISTGYDNICVIGTCGVSGSPTPTAAISPATCSTSSANSDGKITLSNFGATDHYDISQGSSYTGTQTYATSTLIPAGGVVSSTLANPTTPQVYTVRVFTSAGCTTDLQVTLNPTICPGNCTAPTATVTSTAATCTGTSANNNASIAVSGVTGGDKVAISPGSFYTGQTYSSAQTLTGGAYSFSALPNPNGSQVYTVRIFNGDDNCFKDYFITLNETSCGCKKIGIQVVSSDQADPDSSPNNSVTTEDDFASYEVCKGTQYIDLKLAKTVSPTSGSTCPTNTAFVWKLVLTNAGSMSATNIQVSDNMPDHLLITSATVTSGTFTISGGWLIPSLAAGTSTTLTITTNATTPGTYTNCAWVSGAFPLNDPNSSPLNDYTANEDDDDCASITVTGANTPTVAKEFSPNTAKTNTPIRLTLKLTNNETTPITLTAAMVDNLPSSPGQMVIASTPNLTTSLPGVVATAGGTSITIPAGTVLAPGLNQVQVDVTAPVDGEYCNDVLAGALQTTSCANVAGTEACVIVKSTYVMGPLIKKSFSPQIVSIGQSSTLVITIENRNAGNMTVLQNFIDDLPTGLVVAGAVTGTYSGTSVLANTSQVGLTTGATIPPGISTISVPVQSTIAASYCNTIIDNTLISKVSNGTIQVMTGNDGITVACLTVAANPCSTIDVTSITPPSAVVAPNGTVSLTVNGTGFGASTLYTWKGAGSFNPQSVSTTYTAPAATGTYTLTVVADNRLTGYGTCKDSTTLNVLVQAPCNLTATATASSQTACQNQSVTLSAQASPTGSYTYVWAAPAGITLTGANTATATASMSVSGLQTFTVTVSSSPTCSTTATVSVQVNAPTTLPTYQSTTLCEGGSVNFSISPPAGASAYWTTPSNTTISSGTVTIASVIPSDGGIYTLYYTNANGCTSSTTKSLIVNAKPTLSLASSGCVSDNQSYTVLVSTNATSMTTNASQLGVTISGNLITVPVTVTSFVVSGSSATGCVATLPVTAPACTTVCNTPNAGPNQALCQGPTTTTLVSPGTGEQWSVLQLVNGTNPVINQSGSPVTVSGLTLPGVYKFRLASTSVNNCSAVVTVTINTPTTLPTFSPATACEGQGLTFSVNVAAGESAYWTTPANTTISSGTVTIANATTANSGTYTLYYTNASGCVSTTTQSITINAKPTLSVASSGCTSDSQSYTVLLSTNAISLTTNASQFGVTINGNLITAPATVTSFAVSGSSAAGCVTTLPITAPACATACSLTAATTVGTCATATNTYSATTLVTMQNPAGGTLTVTDGVSSVTFTVPASQGTFTVAATFNGLISNSSSHTVTTSLPNCSTITATYTAPASCSVAPVCSISAVATPGLCSTATNTFSNTVAITLTNPKAGTLTVTDGANSITFVVPSSVGTVTTSAIFNGLISDGTSHTILVSLPGCSTISVQYTAPASCTVGVALNVTPGTCQSATNQYGISGTLSLTNAIAGTATITDGTASTTVAIGTGDISVLYSLTGLTSDATSHTVSVSYAGQNASVTYTAPASCSVAPVCSISAVVSVGTCATATNTYSTTAVVTVENPTTGGTVTVSIGDQTLTFSTTASTQNIFTATFNGLVSDGASHAMIASLPGCSTTTTTYTAPASCSIAPTCSVSAVVTIGQCATATNTYSATVVVTVTNPNGRILTVSTGGQTLTFSTTANTQNTFTDTFNELISDGASHTITVGLPGCASIDTPYTAPTSCSVAPVCSLTATATAGLCATATNTYSSTAVVQLTNPTTGILTITDGPQSITMAVTAASNVSFTVVFSDLASDGSLHTVTASLPGCSTTTTTYTAPASCSVAPACTVSAVVTVGQCATATNTYSATAIVTIQNPTDGTLTVSTGGQTLTFSATAVSQNTFTATFNGLVSDGASHAVIASLPGCSTTTTTYTAPASCSVAAPLGSLGDFVWEDNNDNGIQDTNEPGVAGIKIDLFTVVSGVRSSSALSTTVTDANGHYSFPNLLLGDYQVQFSQIPASLTLTPHQNAGTDDALDSDADPTTGFSQVVHLDPSASGLLVNNPTIDAGVQRLIYDPTGYIYCYKNNTILKGGKISVTGPGSISIVLDGSKGYYRFLTDGTPGSYTLTYSHPNGYSIATASWPPAASAVTPTSLDGSSLDKDTPANGWVQLGSLPNADTTQLQNGTQAYNPYYLVFNVKPGDPYISSNNLPVDCDLPLGSIGDFVWNDLNNNGQQDSGEPGVSGVTVRLLQQTTPGNYTVVSTTVTPASGNYLFPNLPAGTYVVEFDKTTLPTNFSLTTANASGVSSALDSDANSVTGRSGLITLVPTDPGQRDILTIDAGVVNQTCPPAKCLPILIRRTR